MSDEGKDIDISHDDLQREEERGGEGGKFEKKEDAGLGAESQEKEDVRSVSEGKSQERFLRATLETVLRGVHDQLELLDACIEQIGDTSEGLSLEDRQRIEGVLEKARAVQERVHGTKKEPGILYVSAKALTVPVEQVEQVNTTNRALSEEVLLPLRNGALKIATEDGRNEKEIRREMRRNELVEQVCSVLLQIQDFHKGEEFGASEWAANAILRELRVLKSGDKDELQDFAWVINEVTARFAQLESEGSAQEEIIKRAGEILLYTIRGLETDPDWSSQERKAILGAFQVMRANLRVEEGRSLVDVEVEKALTGEEELPTFEIWEDMDQYCSKRSRNIVNMDRPQAERELEKLLTTITRQIVYRITFNEKILQNQKKQGSWWSRKKKSQKVDESGNLGVLPQPVRAQIIETASTRWGALERNIRFCGAMIGTYHAFELLCRRLPSPSGDTSFFAEYEKGQVNELMYPSNRSSKESRQRFFEAPHSLEFVEAVIEKLEEGDIFTTEQVNELCGIIRAFLSDAFLVSNKHKFRLDTSIPDSLDKRFELDEIRFGHCERTRLGFSDVVENKAKSRISTEVPRLDQAINAKIQPKLVSILSRFLQLEDQPKDIAELQRVCTFLFLPTERGNFDPHYVGNSVLQRSYLTKNFLLSVLENIPRATFTEEETKDTSAKLLSRYIFNIESAGDQQELVLKIPKEDRTAALVYALLLAHSKQHADEMSPQWAQKWAQKYAPKKILGMNAPIIDALSSWHNNPNTSSAAKEIIPEVVSRSIDTLPVEAFASTFQLVQAIDNSTLQQSFAEHLSKALTDFFNIIHSQKQRQTYFFIGEFLETFLTTVQHKESISRKHASQYVNYLLSIHEPLMPYISRAGSEEYPYERTDQELYIYMEKYVSALLASIENLYPVCQSFCFLSEQKKLSVAVNELCDILGTLCARLSSFAEYLPSASIATEQASPEFWKNFYKEHQREYYVLANRALRLKSDIEKRENESAK